MDDVCRSGNIFRAHILCILLEDEGDLVAQLLVARRYWVFIETRWASEQRCSLGDGKWRVAVRGQTKARSDAPVSRWKSTPPGNGDSRSRRRIPLAVLRGAREASICQYWPVGHGASASGSAGASER